MKLQIRRGLEAAIPVSGMLVGELFLATDTGYIFIATSATTTVKFAKLADVTSLAATVTTLTGNTYTKAQVDQLVQGLSWKSAVKVATTVNIATLSGLLTVDGVTLAAGDRVLVKDQTVATANGIYLVASGAWTRAIDNDTSAELLQTAVFATSGTVYQDTAFVLTTDAPILGTSNLSFVQFSGAGQIIAGVGLFKTGNQLDIDLSELPTAASLANTDYFITRTAAGDRRILKTDIFLDADIKTLKVSASDTTAKFLGAAIAVGLGLNATITNPGANEILNIALNLPGLTAAAANAITATDEVIVYSGSTHYRTSVQNLIANVVIDGGTF